MFKKIIPGNNLSDIGFFYSGTGDGFKLFVTLKIEFFVSTYLEYITLILFNNDGAIVDIVTWTYNLTIESPTTLLFNNATTNEFVKLGTYSFRIVVTSSELINKLILDYSIENITSGGGR
jgi:hypothetical protein